MRDSELATTTMEVESTQDQNDHEQYQLSQRPFGTTLFSPRTRVKCSFTAESANQGNYMVLLTNQSGYSAGRSQYGGFGQNHLRTQPRGYQSQPGSYWDTNDRAFNMGSPADNTRSLFSQPSLARTTQATGTMQASRAQIQNPTSTFYMVVSPNPYKSRQLTCYDGTAKRWAPCWWIKLGDGTFRGAYRTHNPDHFGRENKNLQFALMGITHFTRRELRHLEVRNGKGFEFEFFKDPTANTSLIEWYRIWASNPEDDNWLKLRLKRTLHKFGSFDEDDVRTTLQRMLRKCVIVPKTREDHDDQPDYDQPDFDQDITNQSGVLTSDEEIWLGDS